MLALQVVIMEINEMPHFQGPHSLQAETVI